MDEGSHLKTDEKFSAEPQIERAPFRSSFKKWIRIVAFIEVAVFLPEQIAQAAGYDWHVIWGRPGISNLIPLNPAGNLTAARPGAPPTWAAAAARQATRSPSSARRSEWRTSASRKSSASGSTAWEIPFGRAPSSACAAWSPECMS